MRTIKRYPNRKLYDVTACRYVTLTVIRDLVRDGETVRVVDSRSGKDMTREVLSRIVLEEDPGKGGLTVTLLTDLIKRSSRTVMGYIKKSWDAGMDAARKMDLDLNESVKSAVQAGRRTLADAEGFRREIIDRIRETVAQREAVLEERIQRGIEKALRSVHIATRGEMEELRAKLAKLETRVAALSSRKSGKAR